jgi:hypothetical protein
LWSQHLHCRDADTTLASIDFLKKTIGMVGPKSCSLKPAGQLMNDITQNSSTVEKDCFQAAFVIFVMGHLFCPSSKHDYKSVDYWGTLCKADKICDYGWGGYAFQYLM